LCLYPESCVPVREREPTLVVRVLAVSRNQLKSGLRAGREAATMPSVSSILETAIVS
jgi:hypothetical protein